MSRSYESIYDIIDSLIARKEICWPELPFFLFGHSYGGNVLLSYTHRTDGPKESIFLSWKYSQRTHDRTWI